jgi:hypothetical protein
MEIIKQNSRGYPVAIQLQMFVGREARQRVASESLDCIAIGPNPPEQETKSHGAGMHPWPDL